MDNDAFLKQQIITYMGNKRKLLKAIEEVVDDISKKIDNKPLTIGDGFSGSGIVSRLFKSKAQILYTNDIAGYSKTLNECFLSTPSKSKIHNIKNYIDEANKISDVLDKKNKWFSKYWCPDGEIKEEDRVYFTETNGKKIDSIRNYVDSIPEEYKSYVLAPLLVESSIHNNTNGQFAAFYKDGNKGAYGGKKQIDLGRITKDINLSYPIFNSNNCHVNISQMDTNEWIKQIPPLDIIYFDPPYNKHPYNIYYFLLDIINNWDKSIDIPNTYRGQPKNWKQSQYNSSKHAKNAFINLFDNTKAKYIILSYYSGGILSIDELDKLLTNYGEVIKYPIEHKTYNRLKGIGNYKREGEEKDIKEYLWVIKTNIN